MELARITEAQKKMKETHNKKTKKVSEQGVEDFDA